MFSFEWLNDFEYDIRWHRWFNRLSNDSEIILSVSLRLMYRCPVFKDILCWLKISSMSWLVLVSLLFYCEHIIHLWTINSVLTSKNGEENGSFLSIKLVWNMFDLFLTGIGTNREFIVVWWIDIDEHINIIASLFNNNWKFK